MEEDITNSIPKEIILRGVISKNLKQLRKKCNMTQDELALCTGIDRVTITRCERCQRSMSLEKLLKIAKALEVSPNDLLEGWQQYF